MNYVKANEQNDTVEVSLEQRNFGVTLMVGGYSVLVVNNKGYIELIPDVGESTGLSLDKNGKVIIAED